VNKLILNSYAKLNLYLEVINKRPDHYHNIKTVFERIDLADRIILKSRPDKKINLICNFPFVPKDNLNLAFKSAKLLQDTFAVEEGVDIKIIKRIPVGSGLGGGSSNAATVLLGLNKLWRLNLAPKKLVDLAKRIGSDAPFFIYGLPFAQGELRGDKISPLKALNKLRLWHILVVPKIKVSTPIIYAKWDKYSQKKIARAMLTPPFLRIKNRHKGRAGLTRPKYDVKILNLALRKRDFPLLSKALFNSLEEITFKLYPRVRRIKESLKALGLKSILMSGSGPAIMGIVSSRKEASALREQLKGNRFWQLFVTRTV
jgi:4-diphosphocytidyl-2-C-methyl-D-erythritol kinase